MPDKKGKSLYVSPRNTAFALWNTKKELYHAAAVRWKGSAALAYAMLFADHSVAEAHRKAQKKPDHWAVVVVHALAVPYPEQINEEAA